MSAGIDGFWLALGLGAVTAAAVAVWAGPISAVFGASAAVLEQATTYLRISALGIPAMLVILAVTGVLRGLQDTTTPLVASVVGFGANIVLNVVFVYGLHWGIAGSAWGTVIAQTGMGLASSPCCSSRPGPGTPGCARTQRVSSQPGAPAYPCSCAPWRCARRCSSRRGSRRRSVTSRSRPTRWR